MSIFDTRPELLDEDSQTMRSQRIWRAAARQELDFDSQRLRNRLRAKMFGVDASPVTIGRFQVLETVGSGGMGVVYAAYDEELDRRVAVKLLRTSRVEDASVGKSRLLREAQALAKLSHPHVVQVYEVGTFDQHVFLAMEFLAGPDLRSWLQEEPHPWADVLGHFIDAGQGLAAAHREGIIHRDFKPANILFGADGRVRVVDFGLARATELAETPSELPSGELRERALAVDLTQTGELMGTPAYMSPEQARYERVDARSDQYSFCVALYEALFGQRPHAGSSTAEVLVAVAEGEAIAPPRNTSVPSRIVRAVMRGLSSDPSQRFATMEALLAQLAPREPGRGRLYGTAALVLGGLGVVVAMNHVWASPACRSFEADTSDVWSAEHRAKVETAFHESDAPHARTLFERVDQSVDRYVDEWLDVRQRTCEAHRVRHELSDLLHDRRVACLREHKRELATLVDVFGGADASVVEQAPRAIVELSANAECEDIDQVNPDVVDSPSREELRMGLATVRAHHVAGLYEQALEQVEAIAERAHEEGLVDIEAEARFQQGLIHERRRAFQLASDAVESAVDLGEAAGQDRVVARAWSRLARYQAQLRLVDQAEGSIRRAWAKARRLDEPPGLTLDVRESAALADWKARRFEEAIRGQSTIVEHYREQRGDDDLKSADAQRRLANMLSDIGRHDDAQRHYDDSRRALSKVYGSEHPMVAYVLIDAGLDHWRAAHFERSKADFLVAEKILTTSLGSELPALMKIHQALAAIARAQNDLEGAKSRAERFLKLSEAPGTSPSDRLGALALVGHIASALDDNEKSVASLSEYLQVTSVEPLATQYLEERLVTRAVLGGQLRKLERFDEAEQQLQELLDELEHVDAKVIDAVGIANLKSDARYTLGRCAEDRGQPSRAHYERGLESWPEGVTLDPRALSIQASLRWRLSRILRASESRRARELAELARPHLDDEAERAELEAWLARP